ncbi:Tuftelin-interacting protein 11 [Blyttiomyces sp. JEL0837]|nr:Tuftelin-interacting protein 11 [Blyttiomyces sp. JEL0837]
MARRKRACDDDGDSSDEGGNSGNDDFQGMGQDEAEEARLFRNPSGGRFKRRSKEDAILGIWAEDSDDEVDGRSHQKYQSGVKFKKSGNGVGAKPVQFAKGATGTAQDVDDAADDAMDMDEPEDQDNEEENNNMDDDEEDRPRGPQRRNREEEDDEFEMNSKPMGFGMGSHAGLGLGSMQKDKEDTPPHPGLGLGNAVRQRAGLGMPSQLSSSKLKPPSQPSKSSQQQSGRANDGPPKSTAKVSKDFAKFEKFNKGIASAYMKKMGWAHGQALGSKGEGLVEPIDVKVRPNKMGLGHGGFDERTEVVKKEQEKMKPIYTLSDDEKEEAAKEEQRIKEGLPTAASTKAWRRDKTKKVTYKTAMEVIQEQQQRMPLSNKEPSKVKIIDMTGKEARELEDMSEAKSASYIAALKSANAHLLELRYNVRMLVSEAETDLLRLTSALKVEEQNTIKAKDTIEDIKSRSQATKDKEAKLVELLAIAKQLANETARLVKLTTNSSYSRNPKAALSTEAINSALAPLFDRLQRDFMAEFIEQHLDMLVVSAVNPLFKHLWFEWEPLENPGLGIEIFRKWKRLFHLPLESRISKSGYEDLEPEPTFGNQTPSNVRKMTPYESMLYTLWLPRVRHAVNNSWSPREPDQLIRLLDIWFPSDPSPSIVVVNGLAELQNLSSPHILPAWIYYHILTHLIMPKLRTEIEYHDPLTDKLPLHTWLFPWLPVLREHFAEFHDPVRRKLSMALTKWHPRQPWALQMLRPWLEVLPESDTTPLLTKSVLTALVSVLRLEFKINPAAQDNTPLLWVLEWCDLIPPHLFSHLLETEFFPKWIHVLWAWLSSPNVSYDEVTRWYMEWKTRLPANVVAMQGVSDAFKVGLDLMNKSLALGKGQPLGPVPKIIPLMEREKESATGAGSKGRTTGTGLRAGLPELMRKKALATSFQELLETAAAHHGLVLLPTSRSHASGKPILKLVGETGSVSDLKSGVLFYIDEGVIFVYEGGAIGDEAGTWAPISLDSIIDRAKKADLAQRRR